MLQYRYMQVGGLLPDWTDFQAIAKRVAQVRALSWSSQLRLAWRSNIDFIPGLSGDSPVASREWWPRTLLSVAEEIEQDAEWASKPPSESKQPLQNAELIGDREHLGGTSSLPADDVRAVRFMIVAKPHGMFATHACCPNFLMFLWLAQALLLARCIECGRGARKELMGKIWRKPVCRFWG